MFILKFRSEISFKFDFTLLMEKKRCIQAMTRRVAEREREREKEEGKERKGKER